MAELVPGAPGRRLVSLRVPDFSDDYSFPIDSPPGRHPLLEVAACRFAPPQGNVQLSVECAVPAGSSLGTSASVAVALVAALRCLAGRPASPEELARAAHQLETVDLGRQSGVQDQVAAAFGGASFVRVSPYPHFEVQRLEVSPAAWESLERQLVTVYLGAFHDSSAVHETVITHLEGDRAASERLLEPMRQAARRSARALVAGDLAAYGRAMAANTDAQAELHPSLVNPLARQVISVAAGAGALGWKVNGAGGPGGTVTLVGPESPVAMAKLLDELKALPGVEVLALRPARAGARVVAQR